MISKRISIFHYPRIIDILAALICCSAFSVLQILGILRYRDFAFFDWDLALYAQAMVSLTHGFPQVSLIGTNIFTNHAEFIALLLIPIFKIFPHVLTLIALKNLSWAGGGFVLYLIGRELKLKESLSLVVMILYLLYPANLYMILYEFHFENLALILIFLMFLFFLRKKIVAFSISALLAALVKENIALTVTTFGLFVLVLHRERDRRWGLIPLFIGSGIFFLGVFVIMPILRAMEGLRYSNQYLGLYIDTALPTHSLLGHLRVLFGHLAMHQNIAYLENLIFPVSVVPFLSPGPLLVATPLFLQHLLSRSPQMKMIYYHYAASIVPFLFISVVAGLVKLKTYCRPRTFRLIFLFFVITCAIPIIRLKDSPRFRAYISGWHDRLDTTRQAMLEKVPSDEPVVATFEFLPHLIRHRELYTFFPIWKGYEPFTYKKTRPLPSQMKYALVDWRDNWFWSDVLHAKDITTARQYIEKMRDIFLGTDWRASMAVEGLVLFEKSEKKGWPILERQSHPWPESSATRPLGEIPGQAELLAVHFPKTGGGNPSLFPVIFYWHSLKTLDSLYIAEISLVKDGKKIRTWIHHIGYGIYPTLIWQEGDYLKEYYAMLMPNPGAGDYTLELEIFDLVRDRYVKLQTGQTRIPSIILTHFKI